MYSLFVLKLYKIKTFSFILILLIVVLNKALSQDHYTLREHYMDTISMDGNQEIIINTHLVQDLKESSLVLIGEDHRAYSNPIFQTKLINIICRNASSAIAMEVGRSVAYFMNQYIINNDTNAYNILKFHYSKLCFNTKDKILDSSILHQYINEKMNFLTSIQGLNSSKVNKIKIYGVDYDYNHLKITYYALDYILNQSYLPLDTTILQCRNIIKKSIDNIGKSNIKLLNEELFNFVEKEKNRLGELFLSQDNYDFMSILESIKQSKENRREAFFYNGVCSMYNATNAMDSTKFVGIFGYDHVRHYQIFQTFASMCNETTSSPFKSKVLSLAPVYINTTSVYSYTGKKDLPGARITVDDFSKYLAGKKNTNLFKRISLPRSCILLKMNDCNPTFKRLSKAVNYLMIIDEKLASIH